MKDWYIEEIQRNKNMICLKSTLGKVVILKIKVRSGKEVSDKDKMMEVIEEY